MSIQECSFTDEGAFLAMADSIESKVRKLSFKTESKLQQITALRVSADLPPQSTSQPQKRRRISFATKVDVIGFAHSSSVYDRRTIGADGSKAYVAPLRRDEHALRLRDRMDRRRECQSVD